MKYCKCKLILESDGVGASSSLKTEPSMNRCRTQVRPLMEPRNNGVREINDLNERVQQLTTTFGLVVELQYKN